jgi:carbon-monoxide dehydrogenase small subunit
MSATDLDVRIKVNGDWVEARVETRLSLADFLRQTCGATDVHVGCEQGKCGACTVQVDGVAMRGCLTLAVQADGREVATVAGLTRAGQLTALQDAFQARNALQCGFCTPGMLMTGLHLLETGTPVDRAAIRTAIAGNYCRCTGYEAIVDAIETACRAAADGETT